MPDVNDRGVGLAQLVNPAEGFRVNIFCQIETGTSRQAQADDLFQPACSSRLEVEPRRVLCQEFPHGGVEREFVAARMHTDFQIFRQPKFGDSREDCCQVVLELACKLPRVSHIIDPLVEPSGKLRRNRLHAHAFASQCPENEKQVER